MTFFWTEDRNIFISLLNNEGATLATNLAICKSTFFYWKIDSL